MKQRDILLAKYSLEKSDKALDVAEKFMDIDYQTAINKVYYAVFYMVLALGYLDRFTTGKHHQLMGWFNKKYIHQDKIFEVELTKIYRKLIEDRETADYDVTCSFCKEHIIESLEKAKYFISKVKPYLILKIAGE